MPKYQFFQQTGESSAVRYLCTDAPHFLSTKEQLLAQGYEVIGDMIHARNESEAIAHFKSGMTYPAEEYGKAHMVVGLYYFIESLLEKTMELVRRKSQNTQASGK
ncbi:hypothetical protein [Chitinilyticum litopenaei]|uniref:hypothetical protein n=1 Tax=Chitinilyticum litopenaei TaxID=1121276 RepID=UPI00041161C0|nr:hypothetical protein [Chitinilyticum litopenaei]